MYKVSMTNPGYASIALGLHVLTAVILVVNLAASVTAGMGAFFYVSFLVATFGALYYMGFHFYVSLNRTQHAMWAVTLSVVWALLLPTNVTAVYLMVPQYFIYLRIFPGMAGSLAVLGLTGLSILSNVPAGLTTGGVMGPLLAAVVTIGIDYAYRALWEVTAEKEQLIDELLKTRSQLAQSEHEAGIAAERQRLAHEIHDTVAQGLSSIQMLLSVAETEIESGQEKEKPLQKIALAKTTAADNLSEARAMIAALQPAALAKTSLEGALQRLAEKAQLQVDVDVEGDVRQLPMRTEATLLRVAQGALANVEKHAQAERAKLTLSYEPDMVRLDIVDNGRGFDPQAVAETPRGMGHIGLNAMVERAEEQGGTLEIESAPGQGTALSIALPL